MAKGEDIDKSPIRQAQLTTTLSRSQRVVNSLNTATSVLSTWQNVQANIHLASLNSSAVK